LANLLIQTAYLGDLLLAIPLIKGIKRLSKEPLELVARRGFADIFKDSELVDVIYEVDKKDWGTLDTITRRLKTREFNWIVSPHQSLRSANLVRQLRGKKKIGFKTWWNFPAFDSRVERPMHLPDALRQLALLTAVDPDLSKQLEKLQIAVHNRSPLFTRADLPEIPDWASMSISKFSKPQAQREKTVFLAPGSQWATKRWTPDGFASVGKAYRERGYDVVLVGSAPEKEICNEIESKIPDSKNLCGTTSLTELAELFSRGQLLIVNDSGLMHLGAVAEIPTVAVFGPTTLELGYRPWQPHALVVESDLACRPCGKHGHQKCPIGTHACMKSISHTEVLSAALSVSSETGSLECAFPTKET
jgi:heptosyltransferase II